MISSAETIALRRSFHLQKQWRVCEIFSMNWYFRLLCRYQCKEHKSGLMLTCVCIVCVDSSCFLIRLVTTYSFVFIIVFIYHFTADFKTKWTEANSIEKSNSVEKTDSFMLILFNVIRNYCNTVWTPSLETVVRVS